MKLSAVRTLSYTLYALAALLLIVDWYTDIFELTFVALSLCVLVFVINRLFWKCPHCGKNLGRLEKLAHCHNCGKELEM